MFYVCFDLANHAINYTNSHTYDQKAFHQNPLQTKLTFRVPDLTDSEQRAMPPLDTDAAIDRLKKVPSDYFSVNTLPILAIYKQTVILRGVHSHGRTAH